MVRMNNTVAIFTGSIDEAVLSTSFLPMIVTIILGTVQSVQKNAAIDPNAQTYFNDEAVRKEAFMWAKYSQNIIDVHSAMRFNIFSVFMIMPSKLL